jgi:hypothetical protein
MGIQNLSFSPYAEQTMTTIRCSFANASASLAKIPENDRSRHPGKKAIKTA